ncbi:hypothetical protein ACNO5E_04890 [Vibrio parahaemolyticus]
MADIEVKTSNATLTDVLQSILSDRRGYHILENLSVVGIGLYDDPKPVDSNTFKPKDNGTLVGWINMLVDNPNQSDPIQGNRTLLECSAKISDETGEVLNTLVGEFGTASGNGTISKIRVFAAMNGSKETSLDVNGESVFVNMRHSFSPEQIEDTALLYGFEKPNVNKQAFGAIPNQMVISGAALIASRFSGNLSEGKSFRPFNFTQTSGKWEYGDNNQLVIYNNSRNARHQLLNLMPEIPVDTSTLEKNHIRYVNLEGVAGLDWRDPADYAQHKLSGCRLTDNIYQAIVKDGVAQMTLHTYESANDYLPKTETIVLPAVPANIYNFGFCVVEDGTINICYVDGIDKQTVHFLKFDPTTSEITFSETQRVSFDISYYSSYYYSMWLGWYEDSATKIKYIANNLCYRNYNVNSGSGYFFDHDEYQANSVRVLGIYPDSVTTEESKKSFIAGITPYFGKSSISRSFMPTVELFNSTDSGAYFTNMMNLRIGTSNSYIECAGYFAYADFTRGEIDVHVQCAGSIPNPNVYDSYLQVNLVFPFKPTPPSSCIAEIAIEPVVKTDSDQLKVIVDLALTPNFGG